MRGGKRRVTVWDLPVRLTHWSVALGFGAAWWTAERSETWHQRFGYAIALCILLRMVWGVVGSRHARFADFVRGPGTTAAYTRRLLRGKEERHLGHNPLGGWMALTLWTCVACACFTGWLSTTDAYFGEAWLEQLHRILAWSVVALLPLHLAGVIFASLRHHENLVAAMFSGDKRP